MATPVTIQTRNTSGTGTSQSVVMTTAQVAGNSNLVVSFSGGTDTVTGVTDTKLNTYVLANGHTFTDGTRMEFWWCKSIVVAAASANTVKATISSTQNQDVFVVEVSNLSAAGVVDVTANGATTTGTAITCGSATPANAVSYNFCYVNCGSSFSAAGGGFTQIGSTSGFGNAVMVKILTTSAAVTPAATQSSSSSSDIMFQCFSQGGGVARFDVIAFGAEA
jgi:hypothetical protein